MTQDLPSESEKQVGSKPGFDRTGSDEGGNCLFHFTRHGFLVAEMIIGLVKLPAIMKCRGRKVGSNESRYFVHNG